MANTSIHNWNSHIYFMISVITYYYLLLHWPYFWVEIPKKSSKFSESSGPVVGSTILNRKIPGSNPPRDIFHYYIFLPIITSISNFMCIYTNLSRFVVCAMAQWWEALVTNACWLYMLALVQDSSQDRCGIPQQFCGVVIRELSCR